MALADAMARALGGARTNRATTNRSVIPASAMRPGRAMARPVNRTGRRGKR